MITIKIKNAQQIVEKEKNWFVAKLASRFIDLQQKIEETIAEEIKKSFRERNIEADILVVKED